MPYILKQKLYNFTTNTLKAYLAPMQSSSLSAFMISKTHTVGRKPRRRQLNAKVYRSESVIFLILSFFVRLLCPTMITQMIQEFTVILAQN